MPVLGSELYDIPEELIEFRDAIREISRDKIAPGAAERDEKAEYGWDVKTLLGEQDILGLAVPEEYGGTHMGTLMLQMAVEEIAKVDVFQTFKEIGLGAHLTSKRSNGVRAMAERIHRDAIRLTAA